MEGTVAGMRILPAVVQFHDADPGVLHQMSLKVQNLSKFSKTVRFHAPDSKFFSVKVKNPDKPIAPGLDVTALVEYYTDEAEDQQDRAVLLVDNDIIEIPLIAFTASSQLEICGPVDFGSTVADGKILTAYFSIDNYGSKSGEFKIKYDGRQPITITPTSGVVEPETSQKIKVEFISKTCGKFKEVINIKLEGQDNSSVEILGNVVQRSLQLLDMESKEETKFIKFGATIYGTDQVQSFLLYNDGPDAINYVVVLEEGGEGQEVGLDLTKSAAVLISSQQRSVHSEDEHDEEENLTSLVTVFPNQGELGPGAMTVLHFKFSPRFTKSNFGWKNAEEVVPRKDYALFMHIETVGSINKNEEGTLMQGCKFEIAITGTAIPVDVSISPGPKFLFGECTVGNHIDALCSITNNSTLLPITFAIKPVAHFHPKPLKGFLKPSRSADIVISFKPNQMGDFHSKLEFDLLGAILDPSYHGSGRCRPLTSVSYKQVVIDTLHVQLHGTSSRHQTKIVNNDVRFINVPPSSNSPRRPHSDTSLVAQPNDRASSIRPADRRLKFKTKFTGVERYSYIDPDFALTDEEEKRKEDHKNLYLDYIRDCRAFREMKTKKSEMKRWEDDKDLGIKPAHGLKPPKLSTKEASFSEKMESELSSSGDRLLSTKSLSSAKHLVEGLNAIPLTDIEKLDCSKVLSPQELRKIEIESALIDFGEVCQRSVATKYLTVGNNLDQHIHIVVKIDCRELRQSSPLSQVIPPHSTARVSLLFESNSKGIFERSIDYRINDQHQFHLVTTAQVVPVALELSCDKLRLKPTASLAAESGFRGVVSIKNKRNYAADFTWKPLNSKNGTSFSIRPAKGTVESFSSLDCEVVFYPSFGSARTTQFVLHVEGGNQPKLLCQAEFGPAQCSFVERRFVVGCIPLHLTTVRKCHLKNTGQNHAYFQIADTQPLPGMVLTPKQGVVPVGGTTEIKVEFTPDYVHRFDSEIEVNVLGWKTISLRVGGTVEQPCVDVDVGLLQFNGVYCEATAKLPFKLMNKARSRAHVVFDLSRYRDFSLEFLDQKDNAGMTQMVVDGDSTSTGGITQHDDDGLFMVSLLGLEVVDCVLKFKPTEVASYNFILPVTINDTTPPKPAPSTIPPSPAPSRTNWTIPELDTPPPVPPTIATPSRRVIATGLRPPLQLSHTHLKFTLPAGYFGLGVESDAGRVQSCVLVNNSNKPCKWSLDVSTAQALFDDGIFTFLRRSGSPYPHSSSNDRDPPSPCGSLQSGETFQLGVLFSPPTPGVYHASIPVILNEDETKAYRVLELQGELLFPEITFEPKRIDFKVVPLAIENTVEFEILAKGYRKSCAIQHELPEVEMNDGSRVCLLESNFPKGTLISPCYNEDRQQEHCCIPCKLTFKSLKPVSFSTHIVFTVGKERYLLPVRATADNCLLTNYTFLALRRNDYHITCEPRQETMVNEDDNTSINTEAFLLPCLTTNRPATFGSTSVTSTTFGISTSSYEDSSNPSSSLSDTPSPGEPIVHNGIARDAELGTHLNPCDLISGATPEEVIFFKDVLQTVQRWFSMQAWSSGPYPIKIPRFFQNVFREPEGSWDGGVKKDSRTIFQLVAHLCGRHIPGIPVNVALPSDRCDRVRKLHWMYSALLVFLKAQGALLAQVKAEDLMSFNDYVEWKLMEDPEKQGYCSLSQDENEKRSNYERTSAMAWNDLLLQLLKVFVLGRVTPHQFKKISYPAEEVAPLINPDPLCSNIYGVGERILLAWLNHHYKEQKQKTWGVCRSLPSARWIVNFDLDFMDGLVLAALLGAHCPFLITTHLQDMFLHPTTAEQCLHNAIQVVEAFKVIQLDYDIVATDITEANPVSILLFCLHLYHHLPQYIPRTVVDFTGSLHFTITKHVQLQNPSSKPLLYRAILCGQDADDFTIPMGETIQVSPKGQIQLPVEFKSRFLRPCNATLVLIGKRAGSACGNTLVFTLRTSVDNITPKATIKCESPLYEINKIDLDVSNPFPLSGDFRVVLVEARGHLANNLTKEKKIKTKPKKQIESKTDHGQSRKQKSAKKEPIIPLTSEKKQDPQLLSKNEVMTRAFWCTSETIHLDSNGNAKVEINFVPFQIGHRQCSVLLMNEDIGEFLYLLETEAVLPLPSRVHYLPSAHSVRVSSSLAAQHGRGTFGGDDRVLYWKCDNNESFSENIMIPRTNMGRENALAAVGQQNMSRKELDRRELTNTLNITSVTTAMMLLGLAADPAIGPAQMSPNCITFKVQSTSKHFSVPATITISPNPASAHDSGTPLPVQFTPQDPGHYPTQIILKSVNDTCVYQVECTVSQGGLGAELEFTTPLHQSVTQDIPLINHTRQDWQMVAAVDGEGFYGPPVIVAKACMTSYYPLMFRPSAEECIEGKLVFTNAVDGTEHVYRLKGVGEAPMASEHIVIECQAKKRTTYSISVPNITKKKTEFKVVSDLSIITGLSHMTTRPNKNTNYELTVLPWKRGEFNGVVSFVATSYSTPQSTPMTSKCYDSDSSDEEQYSVSFQSSNDYTLSKESNNESTGKPYRFWYSVEIHVLPPPPERVLDVCCPALSAVGVEITVSNPSDDKVMMNVLLEGDGIYGPPIVILEPKQQTVYQAKYAPTVVGKQEGGLIFQHESVGEFWYKLNLIAEQPEPKHLPVVQSELGCHTHQTIQLENPTGQTLLLTPCSSNQRNFALEFDNSKQLSLPAHSIIEVPLRFTPSCIGLGKHKAKIVFRSKQLGDWTFLASGTGLNPSPSKPLYVHGMLSENSSLIVPFRNPTEHTVIVEVNVKENVLNTDSVLLSRSDEECRNERAFCLLLKQNEGILLKPQEILDIPLTFTPTSMKCYEATVTVSLRPYDQGGSSSDILPSDVLPSSLNGHLSWIFPVKGVPVSHAFNDSRAITIECQSRDRTEQMIEFTLSGVVPSTAGSAYTTSTRTPLSLVGQNYLKEAEFDVDNVPFSENFSYEFLYGEKDSQDALGRSLGIQLEKKYRNKMSGVVTLIFRLIFSPYKPFNHLVHLILTAGSGGVWKFPIRFLATEAEVDDSITVEAAGLNKKAVVGFRLNSQSRQSVPFVASLTADSDQEFSLSCSSNILLPQDSEGTLIKIIYKPTLYGKIHKGKIIIQTADMQWTYAVKGVTPEYTPPAGQSVITTKHTTFVKQRKKNYVRDNLRLQTTAVSSPIKGAPLVQRLRR